MLERLTFDSEAILAFFLGEIGGNQVIVMLEKIDKGEAEGFINVLNLTEIHYILSRISPKIAEEKQRILRAYGVKVVPIEDNGLWREAAQIKCKHSLSLPDAFASATAKGYKTKLVIGNDKDFNNLGIELLRIR